MKLLYTSSLIATLLAGSGSPTQAQSPVLTTFPVGTATVTVAQVAPDLNVIWELAWGPDNFLWVAERYGRISRVNPVSGQVLSLITVAEVATGGEAGLLGMVLHPDFATNPYVYISYVYLDQGVIKEKVVRYTYSAAGAGSLSAPLTLLANIPATTGHVGSRLLILPDRTLLMTTGDAHLLPQVQNDAFLNGKTLRLNLDGTVPANNPIAGSYVYTKGHRNPQGLVQLPNGRIYSSEHGPETDDEINRIEAGRNYGWPDVHGYCNLPAEQSFCAANNVREPVMAWTPTIAPGGLTYYDHPAIPGWRNSLLLAVLKNRQLMQMPLNADGGVTAPLSSYLADTNLGRLRAICVSPQGKVYMGTSNKDGYGDPRTSDDRIIVLENRAYTPTATTNAALEAAFAVTPNPAHRQAQVRLPTGGAHLQVVDLTGRIVRELRATGPTATLELAELRAGLYLVRAQTALGTATRRLMVE